MKSAALDNTSASKEPRCWAVVDKFFVCLKEIVDFFIILLVHCKLIIQLFVYIFPVFFMKILLLIWNCIPQEINK